MSAAAVRHVEKMVSLYFDAVNFSFIPVSNHFGDDGLHFLAPGSELKKETKISVLQLQSSVHKSRCMHTRFKDNSNYVIKNPFT